MLIVLAQRALNEMTNARNKYCNAYDTSITEMASEAVLDDCGECCCLGIIVLILAGIPLLIIWKIENFFNDKKSLKYMQAAKAECCMYIRELNQYVLQNPMCGIQTLACEAFLNDSYIGQLPKQKKLFGMLQKDMDWRIYSIDMAMHEIRYHIQQLSI